MESSQKLLIAIDVGTNTCGASAQWEDRDDVITVEFDAGGMYARSPELDVSLAHSMKTGEWAVGTASSVLSDAFRISHLKVAIMGQQPYHRNLMDACSSIERNARARGFSTSVVANAFSPVHVLQQLLRHTLSRLASQLDAGPGGLRGYPSFDDIPKQCWLTFPVKGGESMKISLMVAASTLGLEVKGTSEALAAAYYAMYSQHRQRNGDVTLIIDVGGGTIDVAAVTAEGGEIRLACATDGLFGGGELVTQGLFKWLVDGQHVRQPDDPRERRYLLTQIEYCKQMFQPGRDLVINTLNGTVVVEWMVMYKYFEHLAMEGKKLLDRQIEQINGKVDKIFFLGASFRNDAFFNMFCEKLPGLQFLRIPDAVTRGALYFAKAPIHERSVASRSIGFTYLDRFSPRNKLYPFGRVTESIGWIVSEAESCDERITVPYEKKFYRSMNEDMFVLTVDVMRTTGRFDPKYIKKNNNRTTWGCPVTLNAEDHYDKLQKLGRIEAYVPKADVFPPESGPDEDDERFERFEASLWKVGQMLHTKVTHKGRCLNVTFFPAPVWMPYSEFHRTPIDYQSSLVTGAKSAASTSPPFALKPTVSVPFNSQTAPALPSSDRPENEHATTKTAPTGSSPAPGLSVGFAFYFIFAWSLLDLTVQMKWNKGGSVFEVP
ncbi:hsp75-like protein [Penicillium sp. IBT 35674x]|nr:hsp75-like protein [Penicillium sp. IBT 35674x]